MFRPGEHLPDAGELVLAEQLRREEFRRELDGDFPHVRIRAAPLLPGVDQGLAGHQGQLVVADLFDAVAHDTADAAAVLDEIKFVVPVPVQREQEFRLVAFYDIETIFLRKGRNLGQKA